MKLDEHDYILCRGDLYTIFRNLSTLLERLKKNPQSVLLLKNIYKESVSLQSLIESLYKKEEENDR